MSLVRQLREEEGEVLHEYKDHLGFSTIGIGRLIDKRKGGGITREEAEYLLNNDIQRFTRAVLAELPWVATLDDVRKGTLIGMAFQMGVNGLLNFKTMLSLMEAKRYTEASKAMLDSLWARQTPARAKRLAAQMRTGVWHFK